MRGWVDYVAQLGYASVEGEFGTEAMLWTDSSLGTIPHPTDSDGYPSFPIPSLDEPLWQIQELDASSSALGALVATISALGSDRPDNPLLLQQSGALWLREDDIDGTPVTVFAAPASDVPLEEGVDAVDPDASNLRLWVDSTGLLRRAEIALSDSWTVSTFPISRGPRAQPPGGYRMTPREPEPPESPPGISRARCSPVSARPVLRASAGSSRLGGHGTADGTSDPTEPSGSPLPVPALGAHQPGVQRPPVPQQHCLVAVLDLDTAALESTLRRSARGSFR